MDLEVTTKTEVKLQQSLWMKTQECIVCQIYDIYSEQHFDWSLCSVSPSAPLSCYLTFSPSLPTCSALPQSVENAMESSRLCLEFICVQDIGGFLTLGRGCLENVWVVISIKGTKTAGPLATPSRIYPLSCTFSISFRFPLIAPVISLPPDLCKSSSGTCLVIISLSSNGQFWEASGSSVVQQWAVLMCAKAEEKVVTCRVTIPLSVMKE